VRKTATPSIAALGRTITWRVTITNVSPVAAADVNVVRVSERSYRLRVISLTPSQGTCAPTTCNLGRLAAGASATITAVTRAVAVGRVLNVVRVGSEEQESDYLNNVAAALVRIVDPVTVARRAAVRAAIATRFCSTLTVAPRKLLSGTTSIVLATARGRFGVPLPGVPVIVEGNGLRRLARTDRRGTVHFALTPRGMGIVHFRRPGAAVSSGLACRTLLAVLGARKPSVTG
jgi:hypothetical protein